MPFSTFEPRCKSCCSEHRQEIEKKRFEKKMSYREISEWLEEEYQEKISKQSLMNHFNRHIMTNLEQARKSEIQTRDIAKTEVDETLNLIDELRESLSILKKMLNRMLNKERMQSSDVNAITKALSEIRLTIKELNSLTGSLEIGSLREEDQVREFVQKFIDKLDYEVARQVLQAIDEIEKEENKKE